MNAILKKALLTASVAGALGVASMPSHAIIQGVPGEAQLIPLFYHNANDPALGEVDTVIRITVPRSLGTDAVLALTAPNVSPTLPPESEQADKFPALAPNFDVLPTYGDSRLHAYYMNVKSEEITNRTIPVTADDVVFLQASDTMPVNPDNPDDAKGYVIVTTAAGYAGRDANFAFFADAWLTIRPIVGTQLPRVVNIPTFAMSDSADASDGSSVPTADNNVVEITPEGDPLASPIHTGIRTTSIYAGSVRVIDLALSDRNDDDNLGTLWVWWNDVNENLIQSVEEYDSNEGHCSANISLPHELTVSLIPQAWVTPGSPPQGEWAVPEQVKQSPLIDQLNYLCRTDNGDENLTVGGIDQDLWNADLFGDGYGKLYVKQPKDRSGQAQAGAAAAFAIPVQMNRFTEAPNAITPMHVYGSVPANDHGRFMKR